MPRLVDSHRRPEARTPVAPSTTVAACRRRPRPGSVGLGPDACAGRCACSGPSGWSRPSPTSSTASSPTTRSTTCRSTSSWRAARMLDVGGGPGYFRDAFAGSRGARTSPSTPTSGSSPGSATSRPAPCIGSGMQLPFADESVDVCYSSNVLEHVVGPVADGRRDGPGDPARRRDLHLLHRLVRPVGRARDGALALPRRPPRPASATGAGTAASRRTGSASRLFPVTVEAGLRLGARARPAPTCSTSYPATTRGSPTG